jgi:hypothetical protein
MDDESVPAISERGLASDVRPGQPLAEREDKDKVCLVLENR